MELNAEVEARIEKERETERYRTEMGKMQEHLMIIEKLLEDKEERFKQELGLQHTNQHDIVKAAQQSAPAQRAWS